MGLLSRADARQHACPDTLQVLLCPATVRAAQEDKGRQGARVLVPAQARGAVKPLLAAPILITQHPPQLCSNAKVHNR